MKNFKKMAKDKSSKKNTKLLTSIKGTPPADMSPLEDDEWWDICRDETAFGIPHDGRNNVIDLPTGVDGCIECFTMCTSHPDVGTEDVGTCITKAITNCVVPEIQDQIDILTDFIFPTDSCDWKQVSGDPDSWESQDCDDPIDCSNECARLCSSEGFISGQCQTSGDTFFCNCD